MELKYKIAYFMIFKKLAEALGGRVRWMTASGAPTSKEIIQFFNAAGIMIIEGYGMTECCAPATLSGIYDYRIGIVGKALPDVEVKLADDGEILIKGDNVFAGYWKIEGLFLSDPLFSNFIVIGEKKKFLSALVNINLGRAEVLERTNNIDFDMPEELFKNKDFLSIIDEHIDEINSFLARYETIKKYTIIENEFSQASGELTASLKLKKNIIYEKYEDRKSVV